MKEIVCKRDDLPSTGYCMKVKKFKVVRWFVVCELCSVGKTIYTYVFQTVNIIYHILNCKINITINACGNMRKNKHKIRIKT